MVYRLHIGVQRKIDDGKVTYEEFIGTLLAVHQREYVYIYIYINIGNM